MDHFQRLPTEIIEQILVPVFAANYHERCNSKDLISIVFNGPKPGHKTLFDFEALSALFRVCMTFRVILLSLLQKALNIELPMFGTPEMAYLLKDNPYQLAQLEGQVNSQLGIMLSMPVLSGEITDFEIHPPFIAANIAYYTALLKYEQAVNKDDKHALLVMGELAENSIPMRALKHCKSVLPPELATLYLLDEVVELIQILRFQYVFQSVRRELIEAVVRAASASYYDWDDFKSGKQEYLSLFERLANAEQEVASYLIDHKVVYPVNAEVFPAKTFKKLWNNFATPSTILRSMQQDEDLKNIMATVEAIYNPNQSENEQQPKEEEEEDSDEQNDGEEDE